MVLIDCPLTEFYGEFLDTAKAKGVDLSRLTYVIITHQDSDHASSLPLLKKDFPAVKVISSVIEKEYLEMRKKHIRLGHIEKKLLDVPEDVTQTLLDQIKAFEALVPVNVDIAAEDGQVIDICGGIEIIASPGHLPGHIAVYVRELKALVTGDAMNTENGALQTANPLYTLDMDEAARSTEKFMGYDIRQVVCYHGGIFTGDCQAAMQKVLEDYKEKRGV
ncbi:MAG: MBL fold metallo-hydrolase [Oscillospiraceae bacterium]|nr:MBL fold metallo-hydrolase [Oscillospiraceae bacterium]